MEEIRMTHAFDPDKLVLILYKNIPVTLSNIPEFVSYLLEKRTYAEWLDNPMAERLFWQKLVKALFDI